jgi:membrane protease YdiL (CAAX protease family)
VTVPTAPSLGIQRLRDLGLAALLSLAVAGFASITWGGLLVANLRSTRSVPWAVPVMGVILVAYWWWLGGHGWPRSTAAARARLLRARRVSTRALSWSWIAGALALVALTGLWIILVQLTGNGGNPTEAQLNGYPILTVALVILMGSLVSPLSEEAAFRGYAQVILERRFAPVYAVAISSVFFTLWHGPTQGFFWSKLLFFIFIWPQDAHRVVAHHGADTWFWIHAAQVIIFASLAVLAFRRLALVRETYR